MKRIVSLILSLVIAFSCFTVATAETLSESYMNIYGIYLSREGDCTLLESNGKWLLIDTGVEECADELKEKLDYYNVKDFSLLISHVHTDHMGAAYSLIEDTDYNIEKLYLPNPQITEPWVDSRYNKLSEKYSENYSEDDIVYLSKESVFTVGGTNAEVIGPVGNYTIEQFEGIDENAADEHFVNNLSLTIKFTCGKTRFLSAGDIEKEEEASLLEYYSGTNTLDCDIMKLSHHALSYSNTEEFMEAVSPKYSYALNSGKTKASDSNYRMYYNSLKNARSYGPVYLVGDEIDDFKAEVKGDKISIYKGKTKLEGLVSLVGGDGTVIKNELYYIADNITAGVNEINGNKYYLSQGGYVHKAVYSFDKEAYIYKKDTLAGIRYFGLDGIMYTGFRKIGGYIYYFDTKTGVKLLGDENYTPVKINGKMYALNKNGVIYHGGWQKYGTNYRYFGADGAMKTGWITVSGRKYYLDPKTGYRVKGLKKIGKKTYYFVESKSAAYLWTNKGKGGWKKFGSKYRYFDKNGVMKTGWITVSGKKYYLDSKTGYRQVGLKKIGKKTYYFVEKNKAAYLWTNSGKGGWKKFGSKYRYFDKKGVMATGWKKVKGKYYYLSKSTGYRQVGLKKIGKKTYYFVEKNKAAYRYSGWKTFGKKKRYFDKKGVMATGKKKIGKKTYKFNSKGYLIN